MHEPAAEPNLGVFTLSLDLELSWGTNDRPAERQKNRAYYERTREVVKELLKLLQFYDVSATWAVTGHLFLDGCQPIEGVKHPEVPRSRYPHYHADWFDADPCSSAQQSPLWYAPDIVEWIQGLPVHQEIGCHSFSHILFGHPATEQETVRAELECCSRLASERGIQLRSFVFPRNQPGFHDELVKSGYITFRSTERSWIDYVPHGSLRRIARLIDQLLSLTPPVALPCPYNGLIALPASMLYMDMAGIKRYIPVASRVRKARKGLRQAAKQKKVFHLWFHPFNLATSPKQMIGGLEQILRTVAALREQQMLQVKTMGQLAADFVAGEPRQPARSTKEESIAANNVVTWCDTQ